LVLGRETSQKVGSDLGILTEERKGFESVCGGHVLGCESGGKSKIVRPIEEKYHKQLPRLKRKGWSALGKDESNGAHSRTTGRDINGENRGSPPWKTTGGEGVNKGRRARDRA